MNLAFVVILSAMLPLGLLMVIDARAEEVESPLVSTGQRRGRGPRSTDGGPSGAAAARSDYGPTMLTVVVAVATALMVRAISGWIGPAVVMGLIAFLGSRSTILGRRNQGSETQRVEALASWVENLRDVLSAGDQPMGAIASTVTTCPTAIKPQVRRLAAGLARQEPELVLRRFADDLDDPIGDLVAAGLLIAIRQGARTVAVLSALAEQARAQSDRRRIIESERAPARREVQILTGIMAVLVVILLIFGRSDYLRAYNTGSGQMFLSGALLGFGGLILRVQQLARFSRPARFLTATGMSSRARTDQGNGAWIT